MDMNNIPNYKNLDENYQDIEGYEDAKDYYVPYMMDREYIVYNTDTCPIEIKSLRKPMNGRKMFIQTLRLLMVILQRVSL